MHAHERVDTFPLGQRWLLPDGRRDYCIANFLSTKSYFDDVEIIIILQMFAGYLQLQMHMQISRKNSAFECFGKSRSAKLLDASIEGSLVGRPGEPMTVLGPVLQQPLECTLDPHHVWGLVFKT